MDEPMLTGESIPADKKPGTTVIGGTLNRSGAFTFRATHIGADTALAQIIKMVEDVQASSAQIRRLAGQVIGYSASTIVGVALLAVIGWTLAEHSSQGLLAFIAMPTISCPCVLGIATPVTLVVGVGKGADAGTLIRGSGVLEHTEKLTTVVFNKTGTITCGEPIVTDTLPLGAHQEAELLSIAAAVGPGPEHPLGEVIVRAIRRRELVTHKVDNIQVLSGVDIQGVIDGQQVWLGSWRMLAQQIISVGTIEATLAGLEVDGRTAMLAGIEYELLGVIAAAGTVKPGASEAIAMFKLRSIKVILLSGDNQRTAQAIGRQVDIERVIAEVMPEDKIKTIQGLQKDGEVVVMIGSGVNDVPTFAAADIGVAIGSGSDTAKETGSTILIRNDMRDMAASIELSYAAMRKIKQNLFWVFFYNTIGIPVAAFDLLNSTLAAATMSLSSLNVVADSAMSKRVRLIGRVQEVSA